MPFTVETAKAAASLSRTPRNKALREATELQQLLMDDARNPETTPTERSQVARAWKELQEQKRILCGIPLPKPTDTTAINVTPRPVRHSDDAPGSPQLRSAA